jgi:hypothetical protein
MCLILFATVDTNVLVLEISTLVFLLLICTPLYNKAKSCKPRLICDGFRYLAPSCSCTFVLFVLVFATMDLLVLVADIVLATMVVSLRCYGLTCPYCVIVFATMDAIILFLDSILILSF